MKSDLILTPRDLFDLFRKKRGWIYLGAFVCSALGFFFALFSTPQFKAEAVFREKQQNRSGISMGAAGMALGMGSLGDPTATTKTLMQSKTVLQDVIKKAGLQAKFSHYLSLSALLRNIKDNLFAEAAAVTKSHTPVVHWRTRPMYITDVEYAGFETVPVEVRFVGEDRIIVRNKKTKTHVEGLVGQRVEFDQGSFVVRVVEGRSIEKGAFGFKIEPMSKALFRFKKKLYLISKRKEREFVRILYQDYDPHVACLTVNTLMNSYKVYMQRLVNEVVQEKTAFLNKRNKNSLADISGMYGQLADLAETNMDHVGFLNSEEARRYYFEPQAQLKAKLLVIEQQLQQLEMGNIDTLLHLQDDSSPHTSKMVERLGQLETRRNTLMINLADHRVKTVEEHLIEIENCHKEKKKLQQALDLAEVASPYLVAGLVGKTELTKTSLQRDIVISAIHSHIKALEMKERVLAEGVSYAYPEEQGSSINVESAEALLVGYTSKLDAHRLKIKQLQHLLDSIHQGHFHGGTFENLEGASVQAMLEHLNALTFKLEDRDNYSQREQAQMKEQIDVMRNSLCVYLVNAIEIGAIEIAAFEEQILSVQRVMLDAINQSIAAVKQEVVDTAVSMNGALIEEKKRVENSLFDLSEKIKQLPKRWVVEQKADLEKELKMQVLKKVNELGEHAILSTALDVIESGPVDRADVPPRPIYPGLAVLTMGGGMFGVVLAMFLIVVWGMLYGFAVSASQLQLNGAHVLGVVSKKRSLKDVLVGSLHHLRTQLGLVYCYAPDGKRAAAALAQLIAEPSSKVLCITIGTQGSSMGEWLNDKKIKKESKPGYDQYKICLKEDHDSTLLLSKQFQDKMQSLQKEYATIVVENTFSIADPSNHFLHSIADHSLLCLEEETMKDLDHLGVWKKVDRSLFVLFEGDFARGF